MFAALNVYHDAAAHSAAMNMAIDEALLEYATVPSIRFYRWHSPALSFGLDEPGYCCGGRQTVRR